MAVGGRGVGVADAVGRGGGVASISAISGGGSTNEQLRSSHKLRLTSPARRRRRRIMPPAWQIHTECPAPRTVMLPPQDDPRHVHIPLSRPAVMVKKALPMAVKVSNPTSIIRYKDSIIVARSRRYNTEIHTEEGAGLWI